MSIDTARDQPGLPGWTYRSAVPAAMFNPALVAVTIATAAEQYEEKAGYPMPWPLAFLVTPLVLHAPTREALPRNSTTSLAKWVGDNPVLTAGFPDRARHLAPYVREGIRYGLREGLFELIEGEAVHSEARPKIVPKNAPGDLPVIYRAAGMVGRMFGRTGTAATIFTALRVQP